MSNSSFWICSPRNNSHHHARMWEELYWNLTYFDYESIVRRTGCRRPCAYLQVGTVSISLWGCNFSGKLIFIISTTAPILCRYSSNSLWMFHPFETVVTDGASWSQTPWKTKNHGNQSPIMKINNNKVTTRWEGPQSLSYHKQSLSKDSSIHSYHHDSKIAQHTHMTLFDSYCHDGMIIPSWQ